MSASLDFGWWVTKDGRQSLLSWWPDTGGLTLDGPAGVQVLAVITSEDEVRRRLEGYEDHCAGPEAMAWLASALDGAR